MQRTKSSAQTNTSKPISVTTQFRFEKVEQLTHLLNEAVDTSDPKNNVGQKVLEMLKTHIRSNYDHLYENYGDNKKKILKHIQAVETNIAGENAMNNRFDDLVKEKSKYDKLHAEVGDKQRKLKKLNDVITKLTEESAANRGEFATENINKINKLEEQKEELEHQAYIVKEMLAVRQRIQMSLREKQLRLNEELSQKKEKEVRLGKQNDKRQLLLKKITHELEQQQEVEIPIKLAEQLAQKVEMYENKHSYNSIIGHQAILQEKKFSKIKEGVRQQRQQQRIAKQKKDSQQRSQLEQLYNVALIKNLQQEKIKHFCCVSTIEETFDQHKLLSIENLEKLASEIEAKIVEYQEQNRSIEKNIESLVSSQQQAASQEGLYSAELALSRQQKEKQLLCESLKKWQGVTQNWKIILELLQIQPTPQGLSNFLSALDAQNKKKSLSESQTNTDRPTQTRIIHFD